MPRIPFWGSNWPLILWLWTFGNGGSHVHFSCSDRSMQWNNRTCNAGIHTKVTWASLLIHLFCYWFIVRKITLSVESIALAYKMSHTLLHIAYKVLQRNNCERLLNCKRTMYLSVLHTINVFLAYSDFTVTVAYNAKKRHFQYSFFKIACKVYYPGGKKYTFSLMGMDGHAIKASLTWQTIL